MSEVQGFRLLTDMYTNVTHHISFLESDRLGTLTLRVDSKMTVCSSGCINDSSVRCWIHTNHFCEKVGALIWYAIVWAAVLPSICKVVSVFFSVITSRKLFIADIGKFLCCPLLNTDEKNVKMNRMLGPLFHAWFFHKGLEQNRTMLRFVDRLHHRMPDQ